MWTDHASGHGLRQLGSPHRDRLGTYQFRHWAARRQRAIRCPLVSAPTPAVSVKIPAGLCETRYSSATPRSREFLPGKALRLVGFFAIIITVGQQAIGAEQLPLS
jgi:hypothetical protein